MVTACLIATTMNWEETETLDSSIPESNSEEYDYIDGPSEEEAYLQGETSCLETRAISVVNAMHHQENTK